MSIDEELGDNHIILMCGNCGQRHAFESLDAASLAEPHVKCDECGRPFIREALERMQAFMEMVKTEPAKAKRLTLMPGELERFLRGKK